MSDYTFVQGDTRPFFAVQIVNTLTNTAVDLTGATVTFYMKAKQLYGQSAGSAKVSAGSCTVTDATNGKVEYRWASSDLDVPGTYVATFKITHTDTKPQTIVIEDVQVLPKIA